MKRLLFVILFLVGCKQTEETKTPTESVQNAPVNELAWGSKYPEWDKFLIDAVESSDLKSDVKHPCAKGITAKQCLVQALAAMSYPESSFDPKSFMYECNQKKNVYGEDGFYDKNRGYCMKGFSKYEGGFVVSRGLLQISIGSALSYSCPVKVPQDLHDPKINLECAVKIAVKWINKDGVFFGGEKLGLGRYWHVARKSSSSQPKLIKHLEQLKPKA